MNKDAIKAAMEVLRNSDISRVALANYNSEVDFLLAKPNQNWSEEKEYNRCLAQILRDHNIEVFEVDFDFEDYRNYCLSNSFEVKNNPQAVSAWASFKVVENE